MALKLYIKEKQVYNEKTQEFGTIPSTTLQLEHSLVSLSKWESKYKKPYLSKTDNKTPEEILYYIKCMTITQNVPDEVYDLLDAEELKKINDYILDPMTATWFNENNVGNGSNLSAGKRSTEQVTSELIYYWMESYGIPPQFEKWHLNRLLTLIRIHSIKEREKNGKGTKMSKRDILAQNRALNAARRQRLGSKG